jgi:hypothetical protein
MASFLHASLGDLIWQHAVGFRVHRCDRQNIGAVTDGTGRSRVEQTRLYIEVDYAEEHGPARHT